MKIKGDTVKEGKNLSSGRLYRINSCRKIVFEETKTNDLVNINFSIQDNQYGIYGNEYKQAMKEVMRIVNILAHGLLMSKRL